jgi:predicted DNA-binding transcriptional regulator YafY
MNDTLLRQWAMLRLIPRFPRRIDTPTLHSQLLGQGVTVSLRTVQRDLNSLATTFPLDFDESKPQGWCWQEGASQLEIPSMDAHAALTFNLVEQYMQNMLPTSILHQMAPWFKAAEGVANSQASSVSKWRDKLRLIPHTLNKVPAPIDPVIQATIYNGLLNETQIQVTYRAISSGMEAKSYPVHPLGLVIIEQVVYLVCTVKDYQEARFLALHRVDNTELLNLPVVRPTDFDIDEFILREFGIRIGKEPFNLVLRVRGVLTKYLTETPVSTCQLMTPIDDEWTRIEVVIQDSVQLRTWIRSFGPDAIIEQPKSLQEDFQREYELLLTQYNNLNTFINPQKHPLLSHVNSQFSPMSSKHQ